MSFLDELVKFDKLSNIKRFPTAKMVWGNKSVADHVAGCIAIAIVLHEKFNGNFSLQNVIYRIALHDIPEIKTGDIKQPIKHHNEDIEKAINDLEVSFVKESFKLISDDIINAKSLDNPEGYIVSLCDILQCMCDAKKEIDAIGKAADEEMFDCIKRGLVIIKKLNDSAEADKNLDHEFVSRFRTICHILNIEFNR